MSESVFAFLKWPCKKMKLSLGNKADQKRRANPEEYLAILL